MAENIGVEVAGGLRPLPFADVQARVFDPGVDGAKPRPHTTSLSTGSEISDLKVQHCQRQTVLVDGLGAADQRLGLLQLRLAQFHDGGQASL